MGWKQHQVSMDSPLVTMAMEMHDIYRRFSHKQFSFQMDFPATFHYQLVSWDDYSQYMEK